MIDLSLKRRPRGVVNPEVFERRSFQQKWDRVYKLSNSVMS
jgi:hypothetical protein